MTKWKKGFFLGLALYIGIIIDVFVIDICLRLSEQNSRLGKVILHLQPLL